MRRINIKKIILENQKFLCNICHKEFKEYEFMLDHIKPKALNGNNNLENLQMLCLKCGMNKNYKDLRDIWEVRKESYPLLEICPLCNIKFRGTSKRSIYYRYKQHLMQKHGVELSEVKRK